MGISNKLKAEVDDLARSLKKGAEAAMHLAEDLVDRAEDAFEQVVGDEDDDRPSCRDRAADIYRMMNEGKLLEAFDTYYHDDVVMVEATGEVREGKATSRAFLEQWQAGIKEFHGGGAKAIASNEKEQITMVESWTEVTFQDGNRVKMEEVAVQRWDGDKIVHERFYYNQPGQ